jgi:hypothetical protein
MLKLFDRLNHVGRQAGSQRIDTRHFKNTGRNCLNLFSVTKTSADADHEARCSAVFVHTISQKQTVCSCGGAWVREREKREQRGQTSEEQPEQKPSPRCNKYLLTIVSYLLPYTGEVFRACSCLVLSCRVAGRKACAVLSQPLLALVNRCALSRDASYPISTHRLFHLLTLPSTSSFLSSKLIINSLFTLSDPPRELTVT